jgi:hypothetical protein
MQIQVAVDTREQIPLLFPPSILWRPDRSPKSEREVQIEAVPVTLSAGDYRLKTINGGLVANEWQCTIERKGRVRELFGNLCTRDWTRAAKAFGKLAKLDGAKYVLVEAALNQFAMYERREELPSGLLLDRLIQVTSRLGLQLLFVPGGGVATNRRRLGAFVVRLMLGHWAAATRK